MIASINLDIVRSQECNTSSKLLASTYLICKKDKTFLLAKLHNPPLIILCKNLRHGQRKLNYSSQPEVIGSFVRTIFTKF
jgi:hypothetical protein